MDGLPAARTLKRRAVVARGRAVRDGGRFTFSVAREPDDADIRRLLRETPLPGSVSLSMEREPDAFASAGIEGDVHDVIVARHRETGQIAGMASRSSRERYVNGRASRVGYLGQLRLAASFRRQPDLLAGGFEFCRALHGRDGAAIYLASVVADNVAARRLLEQRRFGWPTFRAVDRLVTLVIPARRARAGRDAIEILRGDRIELAATAAVLSRNSPRYQFAPRWTAPDLESPDRVRGLTPQDFVVALRRGSVAGCLALWDQRAFKQVVVRGYSPALGRWRRFINLLAPISGIARLPPAGRQLQFAYLSHLAVDDDDPGVVVALVGGALRVARARGLDYVALGLSAAGPLTAPIERAFVHRSYESVLYVVFWPDGASAADALDERPSQPEIAVL
jgi:hypothetical protein